MAKAITFGVLCQVLNTCAFTLYLTKAYMIIISSILQAQKNYSKEVQNW